MEYRLLGQTGLKVSVMGLGSWLTYGGHVDEETTFQCIKEAYDAGVNFFDTAEEYSGGQAEILLGQAIKRFGWRQNDLVISTKLSHGVVNSQRSEPPINNNGLSRKHILEGMAYSLQRLGLPYVDIVFAHRPDRLTPMEEIVRAFNHLLHTGKALYWGTSMWAASEIADAGRVADRLGLVGPAAEQPQYNLLERERVEREYRWLCRSPGLGLAVFAPLKLGILTGKYNGQAEPPSDSRLAEAQGEVVERYAKTFGDAAWQKNIAIVENLKPIAARLDCSLAQLALAWVLANRNVSSLIMGASKSEQIRENVACLEVVRKLTPDVLDEIEGIVQNKPQLEPLRYG